MNCKVSGKCSNCEHCGEERASLLWLRSDPDPSQDDFHYHPDIRTWGPASDQLRHWHHQSNQPPLGLIAIEKICNLFWVSSERGEYDANDKDIDIKIAGLIVHIVSDLTLHCMQISTQSDCSAHDHTQTQYIYNRAEYLTDPGASMYILY